MSNNKAPIPFNIIMTSDGSPTLSLNGGEKMHSMGGAFSESLYIYGSCAEKASQLNQPRILSMGLGLAYNELISLCLFRKEQVLDFKISSFEKETFLVESLVKWTQGENSPLGICYEKIADMLSEHFLISPQEIRELCQKSIESKMWVLNGPLTKENTQGFLFNGVFYDAFSSEADKELWNENYLSEFMDNYCDKTDCYFSTYAATGNLKRALKEKGFLLEKKAGFGFKRESTFATRSL